MPHLHLPKPLQTDCRGTMLRSWLVLLLLLVPAAGPALSSTTAAVVYLLPGLYGVLGGVLSLAASLQRLYCPEPSLGRLCWHSTHTFRLAHTSALVLQQQDLDRLQTTTA